VELGVLYTNECPDKYHINVSETITVDDLSKCLGLRFDAIKIDVEGAEVDVLYGAKETLKTTREVIMECHNQKLLEKCSKILRQHGFCCELVKPNYFSFRWLVGYLLLNYRFLQRRRKPDILIKLSKFRKSNKDGSRRKLTILYARNIKLYQKTEASGKYEKMGNFRHYY